MSEDRGDTHEESTPQTQPARPSTSVPGGSRGTGEQKTSRAHPANQGTPTPSDEGVVWVRIAPSQVVRTVAVALLTAAVVLGTLFLLWQVRTILGWGILALFLAVVLNPAVDWLQRRGVRGTLRNPLTFLGGGVGPRLIAGIFAPVGVSEIRDLLDFVVALVQKPAGVTEYLTTLL